MSVERHDVHTKAPAQAGFTLAETLIAIVILSVGLMAVTNLMIVAATSNFTAGLDTGASLVASEQLDMLRTAPWSDLNAGLGGDLDVEQDPAGPCPGTAANHSCRQVLRQGGEGGAEISVRWVVRAVSPGTLAITVRAEPLSGLGSGRATVDMGTMRTCTAKAPGAPPAGFTACPII